MQNIYPSKYTYVVLTTIPTTWKYSTFMQIPLLREVNGIMHISVQVHMDSSLGVVQSKSVGALQMYRPVIGWAFVFL